ncbi:modification methylase [Methanobrevibacter arboriphilus JCM 13429 = DSM 1125]|uniref:site-specific DNA-methyltransferase (adenine-specific) n=1 Tax=Methanobrevibacter arboriphilus JCM 13429 = DSM 1125 TaxID=1300164 RepID=A0A1V6MZY9_METAZ|nr:type I restriction-modification system subunit M [Methanobrevibacter arboriphilus]OQD57999.1 modification methylase [Methanobrevibacter arboriphilus JCM 13429 = DSM 1125]
MNDYRLNDYRLNDYTLNDYRNNLESDLLAMVDKLKEYIDLYDLKSYVLGLFFYKYICLKIELYLNKQFIQNNLKFDKANEIEDIKDDLKELTLENLGYFLEPRFLFSNIVKKANKNELILDDLEKALNEISNSSLGRESEEAFIGIFEDIDLKSSKLGNKLEDKNESISKILIQLSKIDFKLEDQDKNVIGDAYEYLISQFALSLDKKGDLYIPQQVSKILAKIVTLEKNKFEGENFEEKKFEEEKFKGEKFKGDKIKRDKIKNQKLKSVYDPTCNSGSLLLQVAKEIEVENFYGQELKSTAYNLARMNMILHNIQYNDFDIQQGDSLEKPIHKNMKFEVIVAKPPFQAKWSSDKKFLNDPRFLDYGKLAPKSKADFAFIQHMIYHLDENGTMGIILPHGVLFRGTSERTIRKYLVNDKNYLDAVIGLPANIFYKTSIPTVILIFKKYRENKDNVLFIDASKNFKKVKNQNMFRDNDIDKIIEVYSNRVEIEKFSHIATIDEIRENDFNLNIPRYVDTFEEELIDSNKIINEIKEIDNKVEAIDEEIKKYCDELGIETPIIK